MYIKYCVMYLNVDDDDRVECVICMSDVLVKKVVYFKCDYYMCNVCFKRVFVLFVDDFMYMLLKCCIKDYI